MKYFVTIIVALLSQNGFSQKFDPNSLRPYLGLFPNRNVLYLGIDNSLSINSLDRDIKWEIETSNGTATINGNDFVTINPSKLENADISIYYIDKNNKKSLAVSYGIPVAPLPKPEIRLGKLNKIKKVDLLETKSLLPIIPDFKYYLPYYISSGNILIIYKSGKRKEIAISSNVVTKEVKGAFQGLMNGDIIVFKDIIAIRESSNIDENVVGTWVMIE